MFGSSGKSSPAIPRKTDRYEKKVTPECRKILIGKRNNSQVVSDPSALITVGPNDTNTIDKDQINIVGSKIEVESVK